MDKQRPIKYRALYRGKWYQVEQLSMYEDGSVGVDRFQGTTLSPDSEHVIAICEFIGIHDKYGTEIYEGNLISMGNSVCEVKRIKNCFWFCDIKNDYKFPIHMSGEPNDYAIVGNIFEKKT